MKVMVYTIGRIPRNREIIEVKGKYPERGWKAMREAGCGMRDTRYAKQDARYAMRDAR